MLFDNKCKQKKFIILLTHKTLNVIIGFL